MRPPACVEAAEGCTPFLGVEAAEGRTPFFGVEGA